MLSYFYNPDCDACRVMTEELKDASFAAQLYASRNVKVMTEELKDASVIRELILKAY